METTRPFAPETRSRDRLWFGFRPEKPGKRPVFHRLDGRIPGHPDWLAEGAVSSEPVSGAQFPVLTGKEQGISLESWQRMGATLPRSDGKSMPCICVSLIHQTGNFLQLTG